MDFVLVFHGIKPKSTNCTRVGPDDVYQMTCSLREGIVARKPEVI